MTAEKGVVLHVVTRECPGCGTVTTGEMAIGPDDGIAEGDVVTYDHPCGAIASLIVGGPVR